MKKLLLLIAAMVLTIGQAAAQKGGSESKDNKIYEVVEKNATFPGGDAACYNWIAQHIQYPALAQEQGIQGRVFVQFVVNTDGTLDDVKAVRSPDPSLAEEAVRVVKSMPRWNPATQNSKAVRSRFNIPIMFRLSAPEENQDAGNGGAAANGDAKAGGQSSNSSAGAEGGDNRVFEVVEKNAFVTRLKDIKGNLVTVPNNSILSQQTVNYTAAARDGKGSIVHSTFTFTYHVPRETVEAYLLEGAARCKLLLKSPKPFVLYTALEDFYTQYEINGYTKDTGRLFAVYSELHKNIIDVFHEHNLDPTSSHFIKVQEVKGEK